MLFICFCFSFRLVDCSKNREMKFPGKALKKVSNVQKWLYVQEKFVKLQRIPEIQLIFLFPLTDRNLLLELSTLGI